ncbi:c-type cytochrome [Bradyrhizobium sp. USDA 10063]
MADGRLWHLKLAAFWIGGTLLTLAVIAALGVASGLYSVAASRGHFALMRWTLDFAMRRSVATHSVLIRAPPLDRPDMVSLGAGHFDGGCAPCHGSPGEPSNPTVERMLPPPPSLSQAASSWSDAELFWIVKNGIKYTGMPSWVALEREDEVWAMVAFLRALPGMRADEYRKLARVAAPGEDRAGSELAKFGSGTKAISVCVRCHGNESQPPSSRLVPVLSGQSAVYLEAALRQYANGWRVSGIMQPVTAELGDGAVAKLAEYYAGLAASRVAPHARPAPEQIARGKSIATAGIPSEGIPPCLACHTGAAASFPRLVGQHAPYITEQLRLWQRGLRNRTAHGAIMAAIARRLSEQQIEDVAAFLESADVEATTNDSSTRNRLEAPP